MKDHSMSVKDMTTQELEETIEGLFDRLSRALREAESRTCEAAGMPRDTKEAAELACVMAAANAKITQAAGHVLLGKGLATEAGELIPDVTVQFGGK